MYLNKETLRQKTLILAQKRAALKEAGYSHRIVGTYLLPPDILDSAWKKEVKETYWKEKYHQLAQNIELLEASIAEIETEISDHYHYIRSYKQSMIGHTITTNLPQGNLF